MSNKSTIPIATGSGLMKTNPVWKQGHNAGMIKGVSISMVVSVCGVAIGAYFLKQYHDEQIRQAQIESIEAFISSGGAAKYASNPNSTEPREYQLAEMSSKQDWEVIVRYKPNKHKGGNANG